MACDCFNIIEKNLQEKFEDPDASLNYVYEMPSLAKRAVVEATYRKRKNDGSFCKSKTTVSLEYNYCPFCGKKLKEENK